MSATTGYELERSPDFPTPGAKVLPLTPRQYVDTEVTNGVAYTYQLYAVDADGDRSATAATITRTPQAAGGGGDTTPPTAPTLSGTPGDTVANLSWSGATDDVAVTGYRVYRGGTLIATLGTVTSYQDTGRTNGTPYTYTVRALDAAANESPASNEVTVTPAAAGGAFTPTSIPWVFYAWGDELGADGSSIAAWGAGTAGVQAAQATPANQPTVNATSAPLNNRKVASFDGGDVLVSGAFASALANGEVCVVGRTGIVEGTSTPDNFLNGITSTSRWQVGVRSGAFYAAQGAPGSGVVTGGTADTTAHYLRAEFAAGAADRLFVDGVQLGADADAGSETLTGVTLGGTNAGVGNFTGQIGFIGIIGRPLTAQERSDMLAWSRSYYATP